MFTKCGEGKPVTIVSHMGSLHLFTTELRLISGYRYRLYHINIIVWLACRYAEFYLQGMNTQLLREIIIFKVPTQLPG